MRLVLPTELQQIVREYCISSYSGLVHYIASNPLSLNSNPQWRKAIRENSLEPEAFAFDTGTFGLTGRKRYRDGSFRIANDVSYVILRNNHSVQHLGSVLKYADGLEHWFLLAMRFKNESGSITRALRKIRPFVTERELVLASSYALHLRNDHRQTAESAISAVQP